MDLSHLADQRARTPDSSILPREDRTLAPRPVQTVTEERAEAPLTRREQRVKEILLKELADLNIRAEGYRGLSYAEKQKLEKRLDVDYLDTTIAGARKQTKQLRQLNRFLAPLGLVVSFALVANILFFGTDPWVFVWAFNAVSIPIGMHLQIRSLQRKLFIYEALRELSDADEMDVVLSRAVEDADRLIREIVARELDASPARTLS